MNSRILTCCPNAFSGAIRLSLGVAFFVCVALCSTAQSTIYFEDFEDDTVGATSSPDWTIDLNGHNTDYFEVRDYSGNKWMATKDTDGEVVWRSAVMDISCYGSVDVEASINIEESGSLEGNDYIRTRYILDGGTEINFETNGNISNDFGARKATQTQLAGNTLQIVIRMDNNDNGEVYRFDSVWVRGTPGLYNYRATEICDEDSIFLAGAYQNTSGTYGDTLVSGVCDSIVVTDLTVVDDCDFCAQTTLYYEPFNYPNGTIISPFWTRDISGSSPDFFEVRDNAFQGREIDGEAVWTSSVVNISGENNVSILLDIFPENSTDFENDDYIRVSYILDGSEVEFASRIGDFDTATVGVTGLSGTSLQVRLRVNNDQNGEYHQFDNVKVYSNGGATSLIEVVICEGDSYFVGGGNQTTAGIYYDTLPLPNFCDSIVVTNLVVEDYVIDTSWSQCPADVVLVPNGNYAFNNQLYTYSDTSTSANGCDSITNAEVEFLYCEVDNPDLVPECPMDVIFILDESGSIAGNRAAETRRGSDSLLTSLIGTGTRVAIIEFATQARRAEIGGTMDYQIVDSSTIGGFRDYLYGTGPKVNANQWYNPNSTTNWEAAFNMAANINVNFGFAPLIIFFTDGNPTASYGPQSNIQDAENASDIVQGLGSHIFVVGVGSVNEANIKRISGDDRYHQPEFNFAKADYSLDTDSTLVACFQKIAGLICNADVGLTKTVDKPVTVADDTVTFTLRVRNDGLDSTENVAVVDTISSAYTYLWDDGGVNTTLVGNVLTWNIGKMLSGTDQFLHITAIVTGSGNYRNVAQVISSTSNDPNSTPNNDDGDQSEDDEDFAIVTLSNLNINCGVVDTVTCDPGMDGSVTVSITNAIGAVSISWSTGDTTQTVGGLNTGAYHVTVTDSGSVATCSVTLGEPDCCVPEPICKDDTVYLDGAGTASIIFSDVDGGSKTCGDTVLLVPTEFDCDDIGENTVDLVISGPDGNDSCQATVTVLDTIPPTLNCPTNFSDAVLDLNCQNALPDYKVYANEDDNCSAVVTQSPAPGTIFTGPQVVLVQLVATDPSGNTDTCDFNINHVDITPPTITCPADTTFDCPVASTDTSATGVATAIDNCDYEITFSDQSTPGCGNTETITRTWIATDPSGNADTCYQTITVQDTTAPSLDQAPESLLVDCDGNGNAAALDTWHQNAGGAQFSDCLTPTISNPMTFTASCGSTGYWEMKVSATDACGNTTDTLTATFTIQDTTAPVINCPSDISIEHGDSRNPYVLGSLAQCNDGCSDTAIVWSDSVTAGACDGDSIIYRTWTCTDDCGNSSSCVQVITETDNTPPSVTAPADTTIECNTSIHPDALGWATCNGDTLTYSDDVIDDSSCEQEKHIFRTWTCTDDCGNVSTDVQEITIRDNTAPVALCQNITVQLDAQGTASVTGTDIDNGSNDNCGAVQLDASASFTCADAGPNAVTLTVTDNCGNSSSCISTVTVESCGSITIQKNANPQDGTDFDFNSNIPGGSSFTLDDEVAQTDATENSITFTDLPAGTYTVTELVPLGWDLTSIDCGPNNNTGAIDGLNIVLESGENETCVFNNVLSCSDVLVEEDKAICAGDSVFLADAWQTQTGTYYDTFTIDGGCDSVIATMLNVDEIGLGIDKSDVSCDCINNPYNLCVIDFEDLPHGTILGEQYSDMGIHISGVSTNSDINELIVFNTNLVGTADADLEVGVGNAAIFPEDTVDLNNDGLVDDPDDSEDGGKQIFEFDQPKTLKSLKFIDKDDDSGIIQVFGTGNVLLGTYVIPPMGNASVQTVAINTPGVIRLEVSFVNSGGVTQITFECGPQCCDGTATATTTGGAQPLSYLWSTGDTTQTIDSLCAGDYDVTVTTALGCTATESVTIDDTEVEECGFCEYYDCAGVCEGQAYYDDCQQCVGGNTQLAPCDPCPFAITGLTLVYEGNLGPIGPVTPQMTIDLDQLCRFSISADGCQDEIGSVQFWINGSLVRTESVHPWAINGDNNGNFHAWFPGAGTYEITAIPFSAGGGGGAQGTSFTATIEIVGNVQSLNDCPPLNADCNGDIGGSASYDQCGVCSGGQTGVTPNSLCCLSDADCDDQNPCTTNECVNGQCVTTPVPPLNASFSSNGNDLTVNFFDQSNGADGWWWDFGDGNNSSLQNPSHTFAQAGIYNVCLQVFNTCEQDFFCVNVEVDCFEPTPSFTYSASGLTVDFWDGSSYSPDEWYWDFGDGNTSTSQNPSHTYTTPGVYEVCLGATNECTPDDFALDPSYCQFITVEDIPADCDLRIDGFTIVLEGNLGTIGPLTNGAVLNKDALCSFSVIANPCQDPIGSVVFKLDGNTIKTESVAPYAIAGDNSGSYYPWNIAPGTYTLEAIPYSGGGGSGTAGTSATVSFTVTGTGDCNPGDVDCNGELGGSAYLDDCDNCVGGSTGLSPNYAQDECGVCDGDGSSCCEGDADCDDGDPCTDDYCDGGTCVNIPIADCCVSDAQCDDGDPCTDDYCDDGTCYHEYNGGGGEPSYFSIIQHSMNWKKLKMSYDPNLWSGNTVDATVGGTNDTLCVTFRDPSQTVNWSKIQIKVDGHAVNVGLFLPPGGIGTTWTKVYIPLSAFSGADFSNLGIMEIPFSSGHGAFEIHMSEIRFIGGGSPFLFFGDPKTDNGNDGSDGGSLDAELIEGAPCAPAKRTGEDAGIAEEHDLHLTAYPNPFQNNVTIAFEMPTDTRVRLEMIGLDGKILATLFEGDVEAGQKRQAQFEAGELANGMYFYRLVSSNGEVHNRKLMLLR